MEAVKPKICRVEIAEEARKVDSSIPHHQAGKILFWEGGLALCSVQAFN